MMHHEMNSHPEIEAVFSTADAPCHRMESERGVCETCGKTFLASVGVLGPLRIKSRNCAPCVAAYEQRQGSSGEGLSPAERHARAWRQLCPVEYRETDPARVRQEVGAALFDEVTGWPPSRGLGLIGPTGRSKTRLMFLLLRGPALAGVRLRSINAVNFADELADAYGRGSDEAERWMRQLERAALLFIDDLGKEKLTERVETFYYRCVEYRTAHQLPIFFTSNLTGAALQARWDHAATVGGFWADRAAPTIRRLRERCASRVV